VYKLKIDNICKKIKIVLTDVDGVLTDGGMYYSKNGDVMKKFHVRDGMAVTLLNKNKIPTIIVTKENTQIVKKWAKKMKIKKLYDGIQQKELIVDIICSEFNVKPTELAYIGDDVNDIELLKLVGLSATPADSIGEVKKICNYICRTNSGSGVLREVCSLILSKK
jgi:YrbI family 3-deoxy-D-manno-octulosonate 8-phosphate phosphatase